MNKLNFNEYKVKEGEEVKLNKYPSDVKNKDITKQESKKQLKEYIDELARLQDILYADNRYGVLIIIQAMDAAGKDGTIKHIMSGVNPAGVNVVSFKSPSETELDHEYLWRHYLTLPARGEISIFNRSHYENVLISKVHPQILLKEHLPSIQSPEHIDESFWDRRYRQIRRFEKTLTENGTLVLKFFLHVSKEEQKKRFLERIDIPEKKLEIFIF